jgi:hypothetical protein
MSAALKRDRDASDGVCVSSTEPFADASTKRIRQEDGGGQSFFFSLPLHFFSHTPRFFEAIIVNVYFVQVQMQQSK